MTEDTFDWENQLMPIAYAQINERGDLFNLRLQNNPYLDQSKVITLYALRKDICHTSKKNIEKK
jgi:hypothetical protein